MRRPPIKTIKHEILSSPEFLEFVQKHLKERYKIKGVKVGRFSSGMFIAGHDLLAFYFSYMGNIDCLPDEVTVHYGYIESGATLGFSNTSIESDENYKTEIISKYQVNCFQASFCTFTGSLKGSVNFSHFLSSKQIEIDDSADPTAALKEAVMATSFESLYMDSHIEVNVLVMSITSFNFVNYTKRESRSLKLFFARLLVTNRSKSINKINQLLEYREVLRLLALKSGYNINEFDFNLKRMPSCQTLKRLESLVGLDYISEYIIYSDGPAYTIFHDISELYEYFCDYPKAMEKIFNYFKEHNLGTLTKTRVNRLLEDPKSLEKISSYFNIPKSPLDIADFTSNHPDIEIKELLSKFQLTREGKEMHHCLGSEIFFEHGENSIYDRFFSLQTSDSRSTLYLKYENETWTNIQHKGPLNKGPCSKHNSIAIQLMNFLNQEERTPDLIVETKAKSKPVTAR